MMTALRTFIEKEGLTQAEAAKRLKVSQPRISDLTRGKISRFSLDTLVNMITDAGLEVDSELKRPLAASPSSGPRSSAVVWHAEGNVALK
jgi:predicted XRE-type DNA-binding protein